MAVYRGLFTFWLIDKIKKMLYLWYLWWNSNTEHLPCSKIPIVCIFWLIKNLKIIKHCTAKRLNNLERSVVFVVVCDTTRIEYMKNKIHFTWYEHGWPSGLSGRLFTPGLQGSVVRAPLRVTFFSFFHVILVFWLELFRKYKSFNDTLQYMPKSVKRPLWMI